MKSLRNLAFATGALLLSSVSSFAGAITWSSAQAIGTPDSTFLALPVIGAEAWGGGGVTVTYSGGSIAFLNGATNGSNSFATTSGAAGETSGNTANVSNANAQFQQVLGDFEYDGNQVLTFNNLAIGSSYIVQLFAVDNRVPYGTYSQNYQDSLGNTSSTFAFNQNVFITGSFTADATTEAITLYSGTGATGGSGLPETNLNAAILYSATPEPASMILAGFALIGVGLARRRTNRS